MILKIIVKEDIPTKGNDKFDLYISKEYLRPTRESG